MSKNIIKNKDNNGTIVQNSNLYFNYYNYNLIGTITELLNDGKMNEALQLLDNLEKSIAGHHPLYPYYSTEIESKDGKLVFTSKPNSEEAIKKYPPKYKGIMTIPEKYRRFSSMNELLDYSYRYQEDIEVNIKEIRKLLGDLDDPYQDDTFNPENLKKMAFKIVFGNSNYTIDYLLFRVQKINDDRKIVLGNSEQDTGLYIEIRANVLDEKFDFNIKIKEEYKRDVSANLAFVNFMINCKKENEIRIISLENGDIFMSGILENLDFESNFENIEQEIEFLECLKIIEDYYDRKIILPDEISDYDIMNTMVLARGITDKKTEGKVCSLDFSFNATEQVENYVMKYENEVFPIECEMLDATIEIFNEVFKIGKVRRKFKNLKIADVEKVIKKLRVLEDNDKINIKFIPAIGEEGEYVDEFYFE